MSETKISVYNYEELTILWESGRVKKYSIIDQMGRLLLRGGQDAVEAEAFLRKLMKSGSVEDKKYAFKELRQGLTRGETTTK